MKHNVGDKVRIKSKEWWDKQPKNKNGSIKFKESFTASMTIYCGKVATITNVKKGGYIIDIDMGYWNWTDEMFEDEEPETTTSILQDIAKTIREHNLGVSVKEEDGKLIIEPLNVKEDLPVDTPVMISYDKTDWSLRYYAGDGKTWRFGKKSNPDYGATNFDYTIPFDKFDPNNIEESLKYNIVKK